MSATSSDLASSPSPAPPPPPPPLPPSSSSFSPSPSSSSPPAESDRMHQTNQKYQHQNKSPFRRALQLIGTSKEQKENAESRREGEGAEQQQEQQEEVRTKMPFSLPSLMPCTSSSSSSPLCAPMDPFAQLMASFTAAHHQHHHHNPQQQQQQPRNAPLAGGLPTVPPMPSFLPNGVQLPPPVVPGVFLSSAHPPPPAAADFNALLAIAPPGVLGPFIAGGVANAPFGPPPPEVLFAAGSQPTHNQHQSVVNGSTNVNNGNAMPPGVLPNPFPFPLDPVALATFQPYMVPPEARRKNATREVTAPLKHWLNNHRKNPYPTKAEKTVLALMTKMTMTQVSTWFANARRRLKKENKMTWSPRNRPNDEDDFLEMDEGAEGATTAHSTTMAHGTEGPSSPEMELEEEEEEGEEEEAKRDGQKQQQSTNREQQQQQQQRQRRGIWSIADTLGQQEEREWHNSKQKPHKEEESHDGREEREGTDRAPTPRHTERDAQKTKEINSEQQHKYEQPMHEHKQRATESPRNGLTIHCAAANLLPARSPHSLPSVPHAAPSPFDFLIGSPAMPSAHHPLLLPFPPADLSNARHNFLFALQNQNQQLHHHRSLIAGANPMMAAMFLAQQLAVHHQQVGGTAEEGGKQVDGAVIASTEQTQKEKGDEPEEKHQQQQERNNGVIPLFPFPSQHPLLHLHHISSMSPTSSVLAGQKRTAAPMPTTESVDNGIPLPKRQCRAET